MAEILLTSEAFVKGVSNISDNIAGKYLLPSIREAQEVHLQGILGTRLLDKVKSIVEEKKLAENADYKALLDKCQYYLAYETIAELIDKVSYKITNFGLAKSSDENLEVASYDEVVRMRKVYQDKADGQAFILQGWLLDNRSKFPELGGGQCRKIKSNLLSAASCGETLGGARGKVL